MSTTTKKGVATSATRSEAMAQLKVVTEAAENPLLSLAQRVHRLAPSHRDPHKFHEEKSAIEHELRRLAQQQERTLA